MFYHRLYGKTVSAPVILPAPTAATQQADISITTENWNNDAPVVIESAIGDPYSYSHNADGSVRVNWLNEYEFIVSADGSTISARKLRPAPDDALYTYLLTQALSVALLQMGVEGLHGAAIDIDGDAVVLLGDCGFGKSTLAAHALKRGARLLTDDLVVTSESQVLPGAQRLKIERGLGTRVLGERAVTPMSENSDKWIFHLRDEEFAREPSALRAICVLHPHSDHAALTPITNTEAFRSLLAATFNPLDTTGRRLRTHMRFVEQLAGAAPVFQLSVPRDLRQIESVLDLAFASAKK